MMNNKKINVYIVDDSLVFSRFLTMGLPNIDSQIEIIGHSLNPFDALTKIPSLKPDVVTLDVEMPGMNGMEFLKKLLPKHRVPVILVSSLNLNVFDALSNGAIDFVGKPDMSQNYSKQAFIQNLCSKIHIASRAKVPVPQSAKQTQPTSTSQIPSAGRQNAKQNSTVDFSWKAKGTLIAIGASTGGTEATLDVLKELPANSPPIIVTQHMPEGFTNMYAKRLNRLCKMEVREAKNGDILQPGLALIAPGGELQTKVIRVGNQYGVRCYPADKVNGHRPSVDVLFHSVALAAKSSAIGIILTGMGQDGAEGLLAMHKAGSYTLGQDQESCVVYGMPMVAKRIGAVTKEAPCPQIAILVLQYLKGI